MNLIERHFSSKILHKITKREDLKKSILNSGWLFFDKIIRMSLGLLVNVQITNFLGPDQYGKWSYILAFLTLFFPLANIGIDAIATRELVKNESQRNTILGSVALLKLFGSLFSITIAAIFFFISNQNQLHLFVYFLLNVVVFFFYPLDVIDYFFNSQVKAKYGVYARTLIFILMNIVRLIFLYLKLDLIYFMAAHVAEIVLGYVVLFCVYQIRFDSVVHWKINFTLMRKYFSEGWILLFSSFINIIYMKIDQVMLHDLIDDKEVGIYSAALRLSEIWYFIPVVICNSVFPTLVKTIGENQALFNSKFQRLVDLLVWISVVLALLLTFSSEPLILFLFGNNYQKSAPVLMVHIWSAVFVFVGNANVNWLILKSMPKLNFYRTFAGACLNIALNFYFIPKLGALGAALATLISYFFSSIILNLCFKETHSLFMNFIQAFNVKRLWNEINEKSVVNT
jgi:polysaccharide transporter, PST family